MINSYAKVPLQKLKALIPHLNNLKIINPPVLQILLVWSPNWNDIELPLIPKIETNLYWEIFSRFHYVDHKVLRKLKKVLHKIINPDQTGRYIGENISLIQDVMFFSFFTKKMTNKPGIATDLHSISAKRSTQ